MGIVTDFVVHPYWIYRNIDAYAVATSEMRDTLVARGIAPERIVVSGIPVDARFAQPPPSREELRARLGLAPNRALVLMMGGGLGIGPLEMMIRSVGRVGVPLSAVAIVGRNQRLQHRIARQARTLNYPLHAVGFVDNVYDYMHAADVLLTKPGGLSSSEALVAQLPMVLVRPLPGQEERNTRYLVERRAAVRVGTENSLVSAVETLLVDATRAEGLRERARAVGRPEAAARIAAVIDYFAALNFAKVPSAVNCSTVLPVTGSTV
jgi:processive 1,2-diacylglycerol beta-glucosyltransferase